HPLRGGIRTRRGQGRAGALELLSCFGAAELHEHGAGGDHRAGPDAYPLDARRRLRRDPANLLRAQYPLTAYLAQHLPALDGIDPDTVAIDQGQRGSEEADACNRAHRQYPRQTAQHPTAADVAEPEVRALYIHA